MSNVEPEQPGVIDAAFLARLVPIVSVLDPTSYQASLEQEGDRLSEDDMTSRLVERLSADFDVEEFDRPWFFPRGGFGLPGSNPSVEQEAVGTMARLIAASIPETNRTEAVAVTIDLQPYVERLLATPGSRIQPPGFDEPVAIDALQSKLPAYRVVVQERRGEANAAEQGQLAPGVVRDPITGQLTFQSPTGPQAMADVAQDVRINERYGGIPFNGLPLQFDLTNVVQPVRAGRVPSPQFAGFAGDVVTGGQIPMSTPTQQMPAGVTGRSGQVNAKQALDFLYSLSAQEVEQLQDRMRAAGYFTQMGYDQDSGQQIMAEITYEPGYSDDPATSAAWQQVLVDAAGEGRAVDELLRNKSMDFERRRQNIVESTTQQRTQQFAGSLRNVREMADEFAIETLGRRLTVDEFVGVRDYVRKLQGERAGQIAGRELEPWMAEAPEMGVTQQELGEQVVSTLRQSELDRPGGSIWTRLAEKYEF